MYRLPVTTLSSCHKFRRECNRCQRWISKRESESERTIMEESELSSTTVKHGVTGDGGGVGDLPPHSFLLDFFGMIKVMNITSSSIQMS
ncbi:hypothetical protein L6452_13362 [Arctium lappa]|uniref:Uncharacterized protein n=1 Tax=Arctium lappa TaxID=4217 RepID=A0ACB9CHY0_ARCLA|nr:hypothetical protein L6452_13362 [Arctium lappa]